MRLQLRGAGVVWSEALAGRFEERAEALLGRHRDRVARINVFVSDTNGPRGGVDKCCRVVIALRGSTRITTEHRDTDFYKALDRALERAAFAVGRWAERLRSHDRGYIPSVPSSIAPIPQEASDGPSGGYHV